MSTQREAKSFRGEKSFPGRYDWRCSDCGEWNRYFEDSCPSCDWKAHNEANERRIMWIAGCDISEAEARKD